jgi:hypothetical protein
MAEDSSLLDHAIIERFPVGEIGSCAAAGEESTELRSAWIGLGAPPHIAIATAEAVFRVLLTAEGRF